VPAVLSEITDLAEHPTHIRRVTAAAIKAAVAVGAETYDGTQYRIMRRALATNVFTDAELWGERFAWPVAANPVITSGSTDGDIEFTVNSLWDAMAGAYQEAP
jgi:hypothetical protein